MLATPTLAGGAVPILMELLSPAGKPLQVSAWLCVNKVKQTAPPWGFGFGKTCIGLGRQAAAGESLAVREQFIVCEHFPPCSSCSFPTFSLSFPPFSLPFPVCGHFLFVKTSML